VKRNLRSIFKEKLPPEELRSLYKSFDIIGDIAVFRVPKGFKSKSSAIAEAIMQTHKNVKTVLLQVGAVSSEFRLRRLEWVRGEKKTETLHREFGCVFRVDLERCYFSPRLSFERMRVAKLIQPNETVVNMFAGVGCFSVLMAKLGKAETVYSIDLNPHTIDFMHENVRLNRVEDKVVPLLGDAKDAITRSLSKVADRVVMPLPEKAYEYLDYAVMALKSSGGWIHYYDFEHATEEESPVEKVRAKIVAKLQRMGAEFNVSFGRVVRSTGSHWYQVVLDVQVAQSCV